MSTEETSLAAWKMAIKNRTVQKGLIFHSDRGVQYASVNSSDIDHPISIQSDQVISV